MFIRFMEKKDIDDVVKIDQQSFSVPWSRQSFVNEIDQNLYATYIVLEDDDGSIIGYCGVWNVLDEAHITNIAIAPGNRGKGYGELLLKKIMELSKEAGAKSMTLEVRLSNEVAQSLYRKFGFEDGGVRKNYYSDNGEDALVMWVTL